MRGRMRVYMYNMYWEDPVARGTAAVACGVPGEVIVAAAAAAAGVPQAVAPVVAAAMPYCTCTHCGDVLRYVVGVRQGGNGRVGTGGIMG